jgi:hypothetical protein
VDDLRPASLGSLLIVAVRNSVRLIHLFDHNCNHDYYFELPCEGERIPNHSAGDPSHTMAISRFSRVRLSNAQDPCVKAEPAGGSFSRTLRTADRCASS